MTQVVVVPGVRDTPTDPTRLYDPFIGLRLVPRQPQPYSVSTAGVSKLCGIATWCMSTTFMLVRCIILQHVMFLPLTAAGSDSAQSVAKVA